MTSRPASATPLAASHQTKPKRASVRDRLAGIWRNRRILWLLIVRDLKNQYSDATLGYLWTILDPLVFSLVFWFIFTQIFSRGQLGDQPFIVWLLTGMIPFNWTRSMIAGASAILKGDSKLVVAAGLPREIWVLKTVTSEFIEFVFALPVIAGFVIFADKFACNGANSVGCPNFNPAPSLIWLLVPVAMLVQFTYNIGLGLGLSPLATLSPDVEKLLRLFAQTYRFITPVIYSILLVPVVWHGLPLRKLYTLNPMVGILGVYHGMFFKPGGHDMVTLSFVLLGLGIAAVLSVVSVIAGWWLFIRLESTVLKELA
jgi:ABC-2 type transport system permease protein